MDIKKLYAVVAIADHGSFGEAARALDLSLSSISLQVSALESDLGLKLFDRKTRPPAMTDSGRAFVHKARKLLIDWEQLSGNFAHERAKGELKIGAVHTSVVHLLPTALKQLQTRKPELQIKLSTDLSHVLVNKVNRRQIDCAIINLGDEIPAELETVLLRREEMFVIASLVATGNSWRKLLESNPYVRFAREATVAKIIDAELSRLKVNVNSRMEIDTLDGVVAMVRHGLGVSILPGDQKLQKLPTSVRRVPFSSPVLHRELAMIRHTDSEKSHLVSDVTDVLKKVV